MPPGRRVKILVPDVSSEIRSAVAAYADEHDISRNQVAVEALEARYGLSGSPEVLASHRPDWSLDRGPWSISVPEKVRTKLRAEAARRGGTISGLVRITLQERFGLEVEPLVARRR